MKVGEGQNLCYLSHIIVKIILSFKYEDIHLFYIQGVIMPIKFIVPSFNIFFPVWYHLETQL